MSAKEQKKIQRGIRRESRKVMPGIAMLMNGSPLAWRCVLALRVLFGKVRVDDLIGIEDNAELDAARHGHS